MSVTTALELAARRLALEIAVDQLTRPDKVERPDGAGRGEVLPLLDAVEDAETSMTGESFRSTTLASVRSPARIGPLELLTDVDRVTGRHARGRSAALRAWSARVGSSPSLDMVDEATVRAEWWVSSARSILEPRRHLPLRNAACPDCGHATVVGLGTAGEDVVEAALVADLRTGAVLCRVDGCGAAWPFEALHILAAALGTQTTCEVLALGEEGSC